MDKVTREYLEALNKIAEDPKPFPLSEEIIWSDYMIALAANPNMCDNDVEGDALNADEFVYEFKKRFRD